MPLQHANLTTMTPADTANKMHPMFSRSLPDYWYRLLMLDIDVGTLTTEQQKDDYVRDMTELLRMIEGTNEELDALGIPEDEELAAAKQQFGLARFKQMGLPNSKDESQWRFKDQTAFKLVLNLRRMRPSRIHLAPPYLQIVLSNPYHPARLQPTPDPLPTLLLGIALSKPSPATAGREDEARRLMVDGLNGMIGDPKFGPGNVLYGWANLARLLRRTKRKNAAEKIDRKFLDWLKENPLQFTPSFIRLEIEQDDFVPTPENPNPPPERMLTHHEFQAWEAKCRPIPGRPANEMMFDRMLVKTMQDMPAAPAVGAGAGGAAGAGAGGGGGTGEDVWEDVD